MPRFKQGDLVYHPAYGPGVVSTTRTIQVEGEDQLYYEVELAQGSVLMIPTVEVDEARLTPLISEEAITEVLLAPPQPLSDDFRQRRQHIENKIDSGDPTQIAEVYRDILWRQRTANLSNGDRKLMNNAKTLLTSIFVTQPGSDGDAAERLEAILAEATENWP